MNTINFTSHKVSYSIHLDKVARFFDLKKFLQWQEYIILESSHIEKLLNYSTNNMKVYLFGFGCVTFVNFSSSHIYNFLQQLNSIINCVNNDLVSTFFENLIISVDTSGYFKIQDDGISMKFKDSTTDIMSIILAKSVALSKISHDASQLIDQAEGFVSDFQQINLSTRSKKVRRTVAKILKFQYYGIHDIKIFDDALYKDKDIQSTKIYNYIFLHYELLDRFKSVQHKTEILKKIVDSYFLLSHQNSEHKLYSFEVFLLSLPPLFYMIKMLF